ncbi:MAG: hypothetical protein V2I33_18425, partial [Kangiellaceae bacterium]|nr:hypothetical protein [Kangiellaceae bacterium]
MLDNSDPDPEPSTSNSDPDPEPSTSSSEKKRTRISQPNSTNCTPEKKKGKGGGERRDFSFTKKEYFTQLSPRRDYYEEEDGPAFSLELEEEEKRTSREEVQELGDDCFRPTNSWGRFLRVWDYVSYLPEEDVEKKKEVLLNTKPSNGSYFLNLSPEWMKENHTDDITRLFQAVYSRITLRKLQQREEEEFAKCDFAVSEARQLDRRRRLMFATLLRRAYIQGNGELGKGYGALHHKLYFHHDKLKVDQPLQHFMAYFNSNKLSYFCMLYRNDATQSTITSDQLHQHYKSRLENHPHEYYV